MKQLFRVMCLVLCGAVAVVACSKSDGNKVIYPSDIEVQATYLGGEYCGKSYDTPSFNYYLVFSDKGFDKKGEFLPDARYYYIDLYSPVAAKRGERIAVPTGAYALDATNSCDDGTISVSYSHYYQTDASAKYDPKNEVEFTDALLIVRESGVMELEVVLVDGSRHKVSFSGDYDLPAVPGSGADGPYTTLTADKELLFDAAVGMADYYGDYFGVGYAHWVFMLAPANGTGDALQVTMMASGESFDEGFAGVYTCSAGGERNTFYPGVFDYDLMDSWYCYMKNRQMPENGPWAPLVDGTITIEKCEGGEYAVSLECYDDALTPNRITASWRGGVALEDRSRSSQQKTASSSRLLERQEQSSHRASKSRK